MVKVLSEPGDASPAHFFTKKEPGEPSQCHLDSTPPVHPMLIYMI